MPHALLLLWLLLPLAFAPIALPFRTAVIPDTAPIGIGALIGVSAAHTSAARPVLPLPNHFDTPHIRVHYTRVGPHAAPLRDTDGNGIPDYVERMAEAAERSWSVLVEQRDWPPPYPDGALGGSQSIDIYIRKLNDEHLGWSFADEAPCGDHPATPTQETQGCPAFLVLSNAIVRGGQAIPELLSVTVAHEFMHLVQYGLDSTEPSAWLWEAWAVWAEREVWAGIAPDQGLLLPLFANPGASFDEHPYAAALWPIWIAEQVSAAANRDIWLHAIHADGMEAVAAGLAEHGITLEDALADFGMALALRSPCPELAPYCFAAGADLPPPRLAAELTIGEEWRSDSEGRRPLGIGGFDFVRLHAMGPALLQMERRADSALRLRVAVVRRMETPQVTLLPTRLTAKGVTVFLPARRAQDEIIALIWNTSPNRDPGYQLRLSERDPNVPGDLAIGIFLPRLRYER